MKMRKEKKHSGVGAEVRGTEKISSSFLVVFARVVFWGWCGGFSQLLLCSSGEKISWRQSMFVCKGR